MYDNIGEKIKKLAIWTFVVEAIASIITGIVIAVDTENVWIAIILILFGPIVALISSWLIFGFGELVKNSEYLEYLKNISTEKNLLVKNNTLESPKPTNLFSKKDFSSSRPKISNSAMTAEPWYCEKCGTKMPGANKTCLSCGESKPK